MRKLMALAWILALTLPGLAMAEARNVIVAVAPGFYPITYADDDGNAQGYDVEVFRRLDEMLDDYTFEFQLCDKDTMNVGVQSGTYQVGINSLFKTDARLETYAMPENNMGYTLVGLIQRAEDDIPDLEAAQAQGKKPYPVQAASGILLIVESWNAEHPDNPIQYELRSEANYGALLASIQAGDYDYAIDLITVFNLQPEENVAGLKVSAPISVVPTFPIVNRDETELVKAIDEGLKTLREDGTLSALSVDVFGSDLFSLAGK